jgi:hypothetical protein
MRRSHMGDLMMVALAVAFFAGCLGLVWGFERL